MNRFTKAKGFFIFFVVTVSLHSCEDSISHEASIEQEVASINKKCPQMLDEETRLEKVVFTKPNLIKYDYSLVNLEKKNVDTAQFRIALWPGILSNIRVDKNLYELRKQGIHFQYRYFDKSKELIYTFKISPDNYQP